MGFTDTHYMEKELRMERLTLPCWVHYHHGSLMTPIHVVQVITPHL